MGLRAGWASMTEGPRDDRLLVLLGLLGVRGLTLLHPPVERSGVGQPLLLGAQLDEGRVARLALPVGAHRFPRVGQRLGQRRFMRKHRATLSGFSGSKALIECHVVAKAIHLDPP